MKYLGSGLKQLNKNLENLELNLNRNYLGDNQMSLKYFGDGL